MGRYIPLIAVLVVAFTAAALFRQWRLSRHDAAAPAVGFGVLLWVPFGALLAVAVISALIALLEA